MSTVLALWAIVACGISTSPFGGVIATPPAECPAD
jgi:hypothetical protein